MRSTLLPAPLGGHRTIAELESQQEADRQRMQRMPQLTWPAQPPAPLDENERELQAVKEAFAAAPDMRTRGRRLADAIWEGARSLLRRDHGLDLPHELELTPGLRIAYRRAVEAEAAFIGLDAAGTTGPTVITAANAFRQTVADLMNLVVDDEGRGRAATAAFIGGAKW